MFSVLGWSARFFFSSHHLVFPLDIFPRVWGVAFARAEACDCEACVHEAYVAA